MRSSFTEGLVLSAAIFLVVDALLLAAAPRSSSQPAGYPAETMPAASSLPLEAGIPVPASGSPAGVRTGAPENVSASGRLGPTAMTRGGVPTANAPFSSERTSPRPAQRSVGRPQAVQYAVRATWYCGHGSRCTRGYSAGGYIRDGQWIGYAAISPDLRTWTGRLVRVSYRGRSVLVKIIDCNCQAEHAIDLYSSAFSLLAPLGSGVITVTLEVVG